MEILHMSGAGNDFAVLDTRGKTLDFPQLAKQLCKALGADGLLAADYSETADFRLHFYNPDGSRGEMCGNGARCICKFAYDMGIAKEAMTVQTDAGLVYGWRLAENQYRVQLNNPGVVDLHRLGDTAYIELGDPGIPHSVTEYGDLDWADKEKLLPKFLAIRHSSAFPKGVNVNFYRWLTENSIRMLTFERGVEDYTLACGTGSASTAVTLWLQGKLPGGKLTAENPGGTLQITIREQGGVISAIYLDGPAEVVGKYDI